MGRTTSVEKAPQEKKPRTSKAHVIKAKEAIHMSNDVTLLQRKAWNILLYNAYGELPSRDVHQMNVTDLMERMEFNSNNDRHLKRTLEALARAAVTWDVLDESGKAKSWGVLSLLAEAKIEDGILTYSYGPILRKALYNPRMYARINLAIQNEFSSKHSLALYEICVHWRRRESGCGETPWISLARFRELMGIPEEQYKDFRRLNQRVIKEPLQEINTVTDLNIRPDYRRNGRTVTAVKFRIWSKMHAEQESLAPSKDALAEDALPEMVQQLTRVGVPEYEAKNIWHLGWDYVDASERGKGQFAAYVREKIAILEAKPANEVQNPTGFLIEAVRRNYTDAAVLAKTHVKQRLEAARRVDHLHEQKQKVQQEWDAEAHEVCSEIIDEGPSILEGLLEAVIEELPYNRKFVKQNRTPLENYRSGGVITSLVDLRVRESYPERFATIDARYDERVRDVEGQIAYLSDLYREKEAARA